MSKTSHKNHMRPFRQIMEDMKKSVDMDKLGPVKGRKVDAGIGLLPFRNDEEKRAFECNLSHNFYDTKLFGDEKLREIKETLKPNPEQKKRVAPNLNAGQPPIPGSEYDLAQGSRVGYFDSSLDFKMPVDYIKENTDPDIQEKIERIANDNQNDTTGELFARARLHNNLNADDNHLINGIVHLPKEVATAMKRVIDLMSGKVYPILFEYEGYGNFTPGGLPYVRIANGNRALNSAHLSGEGNIYFHEINHAITAFRRAIGSSNVKKFKTQYGPTAIYEDDLDEYNAAFEVGSQKIMKDVFKYADVVGEIADKRKWSRSTKNAIRGILNNCKKISEVVSEGYGSENLDRDLFMEHVNYRGYKDLSHSYDYFAKEKTADTIHQLINETLSMCAEITANGNAQDPFVRKLIGPMMDAFDGTIRKFLEMMSNDPSEEDVSNLYRRAFQGKPREDVRTYLKRKGLWKSGSFEELLKDKRGYSYTK